VGDQPSWIRRPVPSEEELKEPAPAKAKRSEKLRAADAVSKQQPPVPPKTVIQKCTVKGYALEAVVVGADDRQKIEDKKTQSQVTTCHMPGARMIHVVVIPFTLTQRVTSTYTKPLKYGVLSVHTKHTS
jgi:hypothetical protein